MSDELFIGMLSAPGLDGVDAVLVSFSHNSIDLLHALRTPYPVAIGRMLEALTESDRPPTTDSATLLDESLGRFFARLAQDLVREAGMEMRDIRAIGSHGHSVGHTATGDRTKAVELGSGKLMAGNTGVTVVTGFRNADIAAGGHGPPLAPMLFRQLFHHAAEDRAIAYIGDATRVTVLPANGMMSVLDEGPGMSLLDAWAMRHLQKSRDSEGKWGARGKINEPLLDRMLQDRYIAQPTSAATAAGYLNLAWLERVLSDAGFNGGGIDPADVQSTLAELTALTIKHRLAKTAQPKRLLVCGAGAGNGYLRGRIAAALANTVVDTTARYGADPTWVKAVLFAWLARERLAGSPLDTRPVTGAAQPVLLGDIFEPRSVEGRKAPGY